MKGDTLHNKLNFGKMKKGMFINMSKCKLASNITIVY